MVDLQTITFISSSVILSPIVEHVRVQASLEVACRGEDMVCEDSGVGLVYDTLLKRIFVVAQPRLHDCRIMVTLTHVNNVPLNVVGRRTAVLRAVSNSRACVVALYLIFILMCTMFWSSVFFILYFCFEQRGCHLW